MAMDFAACLQHAEHGSDLSKLRYDLEAWHYTVTRSQDKEKDKAELSQSTFKNSQEHKGLPRPPHTNTLVMGGLEKYAGDISHASKKKEITYISHGPSDSFIL